MKRLTVALIALALLAAPAIPQSVEERVQSLAETMAQAERELADLERILFPDMHAGDPECTEYFAEDPCSGNDPLARYCLWWKYQEGLGCYCTFWAYC